MVLVAGDQQQAGEAFHPVLGGALGDEQAEDVGLEALLEIGPALLREFEEFGDVVRVTDVDTFADMSLGCCGNDGSPYVRIEISYLSTLGKSRLHEYDVGLSSFLDEVWG